MLEEAFENSSGASCFTKSIPLGVLLNEVLQELEGTKGIGTHSKKGHMVLSRSSEIHKYNIGRTSGSIENHVPPHLYSRRAPLEARQ